MLLAVGDPLLQRCRCVYNCLGRANVNDYVKFNCGVPDDLRDEYDMRGEWVVTVRTVIDVIDVCIFTIIFI